MKKYRVCPMETWNRIRSGTAASMLTRMAGLALCLSTCTVQQPVETGPVETIPPGISESTSVPQETADLADLFDRAPTSDGAATDALAHELSQAFQADPEGFLTALSQEDEKVIDIVAFLIAYDIPDEETITALLDPCRHREDLSQVIQYFDNRNGNVPAASTKTETVAPIPTIGVMSYSSSTMEAGTPQTLRIFLAEEAHTGIPRQWWAEIYSVANGENIRISSGYVSIEAGSTETDAVFSVTFQNPGTFYTMVPMFDCEGGNLLASRTGKYPDPVY